MSRVLNKKIVQNTMPEGKGIVVFFVLVLREDGRSSSNALGKNRN